MISIIITYLIYFITINMDNKIFGLHPSYALAKTFCFMFLSIRVILKMPSSQSLIHYTGCPEIIQHRTRVDA